jgi:hypothetical protein
MKELSGERIKEILHILRNPWGKADEEMMMARHDAADYIESGLTTRAADASTTEALIAKWAQFAIENDFGQREAENVTRFLRERLRR